MKVCIYGAGVIGGILASACERAGHEVSVIARGPHLEAIRTRGLTVEAPDFHVTTHPPASQNPAEFGPQDLVIIATKTPALPEVARAISPLLGPKTQVAFSVNGVFWFYGDGVRPGSNVKVDCSRLDPHGLLHTTFDINRVHGLVAWAGGEITEPGIIHASRAKGQFVLGSALPENKGEAERLVRELALTEAQIDYAPDLRVPMWKKYMQVAPNFALCSLTTGTIGGVQSDPATLEVMLGVMGEAVAVAKAHGVEGLGFDPDRLRANPSSTSHKPSMLQDLERGRVMEIDSSILILQDLARGAGVATPVLDTVAPLIAMRARMASLYG
jgi:2-dehydropantoate 2-reductase